MRKRHPSTGSGCRPPALKSQSCVTLSPSKGARAKHAGGPTLIRMARGQGLRDAQTTGAQLGGHLLCALITIRKA